MDAKTTQVRFSFLPLLTGSDLSRRRLPLMRAVAPATGPVVWLTACSHGDEVGGMVIIQEIFKRIRKRGMSAGALHALPLLNPVGFETASRNIPPTGEDLNRSFPGDPAGTLGQRIAHKIFTTIMETGPALVLDLHNDWINSIPYAVLDPDPGPPHRATYQQAVEWTEATGFLTIRETQEVRATLSHSLLRKGVPAVTLEMGQSFTVNERHTATGVAAIWSILGRLGMVPPGDEPARHPLVDTLQGRLLNYSDQPFSSTSGIIRFLVKPGQLVRKGQPIARSYNAFGKLQETLHALNDGVVLGHSDSSVVFPGMSFMAFGVEAAPGASK